MSKSNKSPLFIIFLTVFIDLVGFGMIIPLSPYFAQNFGANSFEVGLLMAIYSAFQFVFSPIWGRLSDRVGRRPVLLISLLGAAIAHLIFGLATSLVVLFISRAFAGLFGANISTAMAYIADVTDEKDRSKGMGLIGAAFGLGFVLGPAFGGLIATQSEAAVAFTASALCFFNFIFAYFKLTETLQKKLVSQKKSRWVALKMAFTKPALRTLLLISFCSSFALSVMEASLFLYVKDMLGWSLQLASFGFAYVGIAMALNQGLLIRRLLPKYGEARLLFFGTFLFSLALALTAAVPTVMGLAIAMTLLALGSGFINPSVNGSISQMTAPSEQGEVLGGVQSLSALARITGPPLGGFIYGLSPHGPFALGSAVALIAFLFVVINLKKLPSGALQKTAFEVGEVAYFQIKNLVMSGAPFTFVQLESLNFSHLPNELQKLFQRSNYISPDKIVSYLHDNQKALTEPIILVCSNGAVSKKMAQQLEAAGFINTYRVAGGLAGIEKDYFEETRPGGLDGKLSTT